MKKTMFKIALSMGILISTVASAAITPAFPVLTPVNIGSPIYASDINSIITALQNLDKRAMQVSGTNITFLDSTGTARSAGNEITITDTGNVGIGTATPTTKLDVKGGVTMNVKRVTTTNYAFTNTDYIVHFSTGGTGTSTLPAAASNVGRILILANHSGATKSIGSYRTGSATTATTLASNAEINLTSDGTEWFVISN